MRNRQFEFFDRFTPKYADDRLQFALEDLATSEAGSLSVIDVGCGNGATLAYLQTHPLASVTGIDPSASYVAQAKDAVQGEFSVGSILDQDDLTPHFARYDRVVMASVLHHLVDSTRRKSKENAGRAVANCLSLLRPGGRVYIFEPITGPPALMTVAFWFKQVGILVFGNRRVELGAQWINVGAPLVSYLDHEELVALVDQAGGKVIETVVPIDNRLLGAVRRRHAGYIIEKK